MKIIYRAQFVIVISLMLFGSMIPRSDAGTLNRSRFEYQEQSPAEWQRYNVNGEEFSVLLPVVPAMSTSDMHIDARTSRRERILGAYSNGVVYAIYTFEKKSLSLEDLVRRFISSNEQARPTEPVTVTGITGTSSRFETDDRIATIQLFATAENLYVFQVVGDRQGDPAAGISKFLSSVRFGKQPEGISVADGPGEQAASNSQTAQGQQTVFSGKEVARKVSVITRPEPQYTDEARKDGVTGTVVLRAVFSRSGAVTNIKAVSELPDGLTDKAIGAAREIRFIPAIKDGQFVSMWIQLQYNFNLF